MFSAAALGVIPCAAVMGEATEAIAAKTGPTSAASERDVGNAPELIIAFFALLEGLQEVVKASIVGSIIGNVLLVRAPRRGRRLVAREADLQPDGRERAVGMLTLALAALIFPALFQLIHGGGFRASGEDLSTSARTSRSSRSAWRLCCSELRRRALCSP